MPRLSTLKPAVPTLGTRVGGIAVTYTRGTSTQRGYGYRWQRYREAWLRSHPLCGDRLDGSSPEHSDCLRIGRVSAATDVDHIKRITGPSDPLFWDRLNHQSLCHSCHSVKTQAEGSGDDAMVAGCTR